MKKILAIVLVYSAYTWAADPSPYAVESAIFKVEVPNPNSNRIGFGSGVLVARDKILTNCHVLQGSGGWPRVVHRQTGQQFSVTKHYNLGSLDACILVGRFAGIPVRLQSELHEAENVWIFGFPAGVPVVGQGRVNSVVDTDKGKSILLNAFCAPGSSGGPVVNVKGELVGLNWGVFQYQNQCLAIPASVLLPHLGSG